MKKSFAMMKKPFGTREPANSDDHASGEKTFSTANGAPQASSPQPYSSSAADDGMRYNHFSGSSTNSNFSETVIDTLTGYPKVATPSAKSVTVISSDAEITGDLKTQGDLNMMGTINGNVEIKGNINTSGTISGNVVAGSAYISGGKIEGDFFNSEGNVRIEESAELLCNLATGNLETSGRITGDIEAEGSVVINETAVVSGNITSKYLTVKEGAKISGTVKIGDF